MKRKLTGAFFQSLDGVIQAPGAPEEDRSGGFRFGGWTAPFWDESMQAPTARIFDEPEFDLLLGKRTYDIFAAYWPYNQDHAIGVKFQRINKYVLTHADEPLTWEGSHKLCGDTAEAVAAVKQSEGRDLLIQGSSSLYGPLLAAGLIDRLILMTFPVLLGQGRRVFDGSQKPGALKLVEHFVSNSGVVFATYEPAGEVPTGSFETKEPSAAELNRRAAWAQEEASAPRAAR
ncbi:dihydrofolate reductase [Dyella halodurans]|uniref:Dihydrofolate reductase family protein n=1 Tax=Dyella halodurans TaxID=1920171 RepID=A0ABV9C1N1_9GAMM|nr:dihydrofolate reductase family protein [Dyella halodurans]